MSEIYSLGLIHNRIKEIHQGLNGHNAKIYSGMEQLFVVQLNEIEKIQLIKKYNKAVFYASDFIVNKLAFNEYNRNTVSITTDEEPKNVNSATDSNGKDITAETNRELIKEAEKIFKRVWVLPINTKKSKFNVKTQGEHKGKTYHSEVTAFVNGAGRVSVEFFDALLNTELAVIFKDSNGNFRLLFDPVYSVEMEVEQDSGEGLTNEAGFTVSFNLDSKLPPVYLYGSFEVIAGVKNEGEDLFLAEVYTAPVPSKALGDSDVKKYPEVGIMNEGDMESGI